MALDIKFVLIVLSLINLITFGLYGIDKRRAIQSRSRIRERTLHLWMLAGGTIGAWMGQRIFRHKTVKGRFQIVFWILLVLQVGIVVLYWTR